MDAGRLERHHQSSSSRRVSTASPVLYAEDDDEDDAADDDDDKVYSPMSFPSSSRVETKDEELTLKDTYDEVVFGFLRSEEFPRRQLIPVVDSAAFRGGILLCIAVNSVLLATYDPVDRDADWNSKLEESEWFFQIVFTLEMVMKMLALGVVFNKHAYLRDVYNAIDFIVVLLGWVALAPDTGDNQFSSIRLVRLLRPLRTIKSFPQLGVMVESLLLSGPQLINVSFMILILFSVFGIVGIQLFAGRLQQRCLSLEQAPLVQGSNATALEIAEAASTYEWDGELCTSTPSSIWGGRGCDKPASANASATSCLVMQRAVLPYNPYRDPVNAGYVSFDDFGDAVLTIFVAITLEGWADLQYWSSQATTDWAWVYYVLLLFACAFTLFNCFVAVICANFSQERDRSTKEQLRRKVVQLEVAVAFTAGRKNELIRRPFALPGAAGYDGADGTAGDNKSGAWAKTDPHLGDVERVLHMTTESENGGIILPPLSTRKRIQLGLAPKKTRSQTDEDTAARKLSSMDSGSKILDVDGASDQNKAGPTFTERVAKAKNLLESAGVLFESGRVATAKEVTASAMELLGKGAPARLNRSARVVPDFGRSSSGTGSEPRNLNVTHRDQILEATNEEILGYGRGQNPNASMKQRAAYVVISQWWFNPFVMLCIVINTLVLALEYYNQPPEMTDVLELTNLILTAVFTVEMVLKVIGLGIKAYMADPFNTFDAAVVFMSWIEIFLLREGGVSALRALRLLRVFKLARSWQTLQENLRKIASTIGEVGPYAFLIGGIVLPSFALLGMQIFGGMLVVPAEHEDRASLCPPSDRNASYDFARHCPDRANYDNFIWAYITTFQIISGENWNEVMYLAVGSTSWGAKYYYVFVFFVGNFVMLNLFLAILIDAFLRSEGPTEDDLNLEAAHRVVSKHGLSPLERNPVSAAYSSTDVAIQPDGGDAAEDDATPQKDEARRKIMRIVNRRTIEDQIKANSSFEDHESFPHRSLGCFENTSPVRRTAAFIALSKPFELFVVLLIIFSCVLLVLDAPTLPEFIENGDTLTAMDNVTTLLFALEALLKIVAFGLIQHDGAYLRDPWNDLDFFIVLMSIIGFALRNDGSEASASLGALKALRALRALRPLRMVRRFERLRIVMNSLGAAIQSVSEVGMVVFLFYLIAAILAYNFFGGRLYSCNDISRTCFPALGVEDCPPQLACLGNNCTDSSSGEKGVACEWSNPTYSSAGTEFSFDNVAISMLTLYEVSSLELWLDVMFACTDITNTGHAPLRFAEGAASTHVVFVTLFFVVFIFFSNFFMLNLLVSRMIATFFEEKDSLSGSAFMTPGQRQWVEMQAIAAFTTPKKLEGLPALGTHRRRVYDFVESTAFEWGIQILIILNVVVMATISYNQSEDWTNFQEDANTLFWAFFLLEALLKLYGLGLAKYFRSNWCRFDFFIVLLGAAGLYFRYGDSGSELPFDFTILRVARVARIFKLIQSMPDVRALMDSIVRALPAMVNVLFIFLLFEFMFAVLGMSFFGAKEEEDRVRGDFVTDYANFDTWRNSMLVLFRCSTGESWNGIMHEYAARSPALAYAYFVVYTLLSQFVLLPLVIGVILENFEREMEYRGEEKLGRPFLGAVHIAEFRKAWSEIHHRVTSAATAKRASNDKFVTPLPLPEDALPAQCVRDLLLMLKAPLGLKGAKTSTPRRDMMRALRLVAVPIDEDGNINFYRTLRAMVHRHYLEHHRDSKIAPEIQLLLDQKLSDKKKGVMGFVAMHCGEETVSTDELFAAQYCQAVIRSFIKRKETQRRLEREQRRERKRVAKRLKNAILSGPEAQRFKRNKIGRRDDGP